MTEQQKYRILEVRDGMELREYAACVVADVVVDGGVERAATDAFRPLFNYISGANQSSSSIAMTAPVIQQSASERLDMTAPVLQQKTTDERWRVSFVLPGSRPIAEYPAPTDQRVTLREVPAQIAAARSWSGRWTSRNVAKHTEELRRDIESAGWQIDGDVRWARFDPPWKPPFARLNEIVIPVRVPAG